MDVDLVEVQIDDGLEEPRGNELLRGALVRAGHVQEQALIFRLAEELMIEVREFEALRAAPRRGLVPREQLDHVVLEQRVDQLLDPLLVLGLELDQPLREAQTPRVIDGHQKAERQPALELREDLPDPGLLLSVTLN